MSKIFTTRIDVRFRDLDALGHVNNAVYFTYFEEGRKFFFYKVMNATDVSAFPFILAHVSCDYVRPVVLGARLSLQMWVKEIGNKSFNFGYKLVDSADESILYARGESVQVCFDYSRNKSMDVPAELRQKLGEYQALG